jgi:hypothetical protein
MSTSLPLLHPRPSGWADLGAPAAPEAQSHPRTADAGWFGTSASGRVLSADPHAGAGRDVQAWADAVLSHLLAPGTPR